MRLSYLFNLRILYFTFNSCTGYVPYREHIYYLSFNEGNGFNMREVIGADPESFLKIPHEGSSYIGKDKNHVYWDGIPINKIDSQSFEVIGNWFFKDSENVYFFGFYNDIQNCSIPDANPKTFSVFPKYPWGKDDRSIFWANQTITIKNPNSFYPISKDWGRSNSEIFFHSELLENANISTFEPLHGNFAKDRYHIYYKTRIIDVAHPEKFTPLSSSTAHDCEFFYSDGKRSQLNEDTFRKRWTSFLYTEYNCE